MGDGITIQVPAGALSNDGTITVADPAATGPVPAPPDYLSPLVQPVKIGLVGATLTQPVTLTIAFDPQSLPPGTTADLVTAVYYDDQLQTWLPEGGTVDLDSGTITVSVQHFSVWGVALVSLEKTLDLAESVVSLDLIGAINKTFDLIGPDSCLTESTVSDGVSYDVSVDSSASDEVLQGCIGAAPAPDNSHFAAVDPAPLEIFIRNLRSFDVGITCQPTSTASACAEDVSVAGENSAVLYDVSKTPKLTVSASLTVDSILTILVRLGLDWVPGGNAVSRAATKFIEQRVKARYLSDANTILNDLNQGDEKSAVDLITRLANDVQVEKVLEDSLADYLSTPEGRADVAQHLVEVGVQQGLKVLLLSITGGLGTIIQESAEKYVKLTSNVFSVLDELVTLFVNHHPSVVFTATRASSSPPPTSSCIATGTTNVDKYFFKHPIAWLELTTFEVKPDCTMVATLVYQIKEDSYWVCPDFAPDGYTYLILPHGNKVKATSWSCTHDPGEYRSGSSYPVTIVFPQIEPSDMPFGMSMTDENLIPRQINDITLNNAP